ncbi:hypothetical protein Tco_1325775 [Tanacetum coccineum]
MAALYEEYDTIQASIDADALFAAKLQQEEREQFTIKERAHFLVETIATQRKFRAAQRACLWLQIQSAERKDFMSNHAGSGKKMIAVATQLYQQRVEEDRQLTDYEHEKEEFKMWFKVVSDEEETIIRADGNTSYHKLLSSMLKKFDRQDLVDLHRLVMKRFEDTTPEGYNLLLWGDLNVMFELNAEDEIWGNQQDWTLIRWKLYHLIKEMLQKMLNWKLEAEAESTMAFELLKFIKSQIEE